MSHFSLDSIENAARSISSDEQSIQIVLKEMVNANLNCLLVARVLVRSTIYRKNKNWFHDAITVL